MDGEDANVGADTDAPRVTYDRIAAHFAATREYPWPEVSSFLDDEATSQMRGLDLGCGNGRHAEAMADRIADVVGFDASRGLLEQARARASERTFETELVQGDAATLPFHDDVFDVAVYVATLHHLRTRDARVSSLTEMGRVLAPGGRALVSAWSTEHDRFDAEEGFDTAVDWTLPGGERVPRYYHIYAPDEFESDLAASSLRPVDVFVSSGNCYAVVEPSA
jgi:ubiquinone/menaquinone biosynthesis C-methylase UbiE